MLVFSFSYRDIFMKNHAATCIDKKIFLCRRQMAVQPGGSGYRLDIPVSLLVSHNIS